MITSPFAAISFIQFTCVLQVKQIYHMFTLSVDTTVCPTSSQSLSMQCSTVMVCFIMKLWGMTCVDALSAQPREPRFGLTTTALFLFCLYFQLSQDQSHSQSRLAPFPVKISPIPSQDQPHSQSRLAPFPVNISPIPRPKNEAKSRCPENIFLRDIVFKVTSLWRSELCVANTRLLTVVACLVTNTEQLE